MANRGRGWRRLSLPTLLIAVGVVMCFAPIVTDLYFRIVQRSEVNTMSATAEAVDSEEKELLLTQARAYNAWLGGYEDPAVGGISDPLPYDRQLSVDGDEVMGWVEIPRADVVMKVYHGIGEPALSAGVGHQPETSLPVGGARSHCYLTGHSGLQQHRIFDGIRALEEGDVFAIHVLGDAYAYRVTGWEIVGPDEVDLTPTDGDKCTLVTCTTTPDEWNPKGRIGINDKRLLVHGERCEYDPEEFEQTEPDVSAYVNDNTRPALIGTGLLLAFAAMLLIGRYVQKKRRKPLGRHDAQR